MIDLRTRYLGLELKNPIVPSAGPLTKDLDMVRRLEDAGAAAVVMHSLFEEQINTEIHELDIFLTQGTEAYPESIDYFPDREVYHFEPETHIEQLRKMKEMLSIPVIGSLNGVSPGGWIQYARYMEQAGADALELNVYYVPTDPLLPGSEVEQDYIDVLKEVKGTVEIPVSMKLSPYFSNTASMVRRLVEAGANGLVLFNRFYQPDIDLERLEVVPSVDLSDSQDLRLPLRWIAILHDRVQASLGLSGGVHTADDVLKGLMAGADVAMMTGALLKHGPTHISHVLTDLQAWMEEREYISVEQMKGSMSQKAVREPAAFERAHYTRALNTFAIPEIRREAAQVRKTTD